MAREGVRNLQRKTEADNCRIKDFYARDSISRGSQFSDRDIIGE